MLLNYTWYSQDYLVFSGIRYLVYSLVFSGIRWYSPVFTGIQWYSGERIGIRWYSGFSVTRSFCLHETRPSTKVKVKPKYILHKYICYK